MPDYSGIRPKLIGPQTATGGGQPDDQDDKRDGMLPGSTKSGAADFSIQGPSAHGVTGLVNLFGIESPGLTASLAIAEHVADVLEATT